MKTLVRIAALLLAVSFNPIAARASTTKNPVKSDQDTSGISPSECDTVSENLVDNCGFETGTWYPWRIGEVCFCGVTTSARFSGKFGVQYGSPCCLEPLYQRVPTVAGQKYALTFWLRNTGQPNAFRVYWDGALVYDLVDAPDFPWTPFCLEGLVASQDQTVLQFGFYNQPEWWFIDDIVLVPYPE
jgi:hypothetical protein